MIVNMYVDHLMSPPPASAEEVWNATRVHAKLFSDAAARIGLTPAEYQEFRGNLLDGKAVFVRLPRHFDAMAGNRRGSVYAVKNAVMQESVMGWRVALADGNVVYIPQVCGNISLAKHAVVAQRHKPIRRVAAVTHVPTATYVPSIATAPETPVTVTPPVEAPVATPAIAQVVPASSTHGTILPFFIPAAVGGIVAGLVHGGSTPVPPCKAGSNSMNVCSR